MMGSLIHAISRGQESDTYFIAQFPECIAERGTNEIQRLKDGKCNGGKFKMIEWEFNGGDCVKNFKNLAFPGCLVDNPEDFLGIKKCDGGP